MQKGQKKNVVNEMYRKFPEFSDFSIYSMNEMRKSKGAVLGQLSAWLNTEILPDEEKIEKNHIFLTRVAEFINELEENHDTYQGNVKNWICVDFLYSIDEKPLLALKPFLSEKIIDMAISYHKGYGFCPKIY